MLFVTETYLVELIVFQKFIDQIKLPFQAITVLKRGGEIKKSIHAFLSFV